MISSILARRFQRKVAKVIGNATVLAFLLVGACTPHADGILREGPVAIGQEAAVGGPRARPVKLIEDSRCPRTLRCVWAGRVVVRTIITTGSGQQTVDLTLGKRVPIADGTFGLISVTPEKSGRREGNLRDYRFGFEFQGGR